MRKCPFSHLSIIVILQAASHMQKLINRDVIYQLVSIPQLKERCSIPTFQYRINMLRYRIIESKLPVLNESYDTHGCIGFYHAAKRYEVCFLQQRTLGMILNPGYEGAIVVLVCHTHLI